MHISAIKVVASLTSIRANDTGSVYAAEASARFEVGSSVVELNFYERIAMERFIVIAMGLSFAISAAQATPTLNITEVPAKPSFNFDQLIATFNGAPASFVKIMFIVAREK